MKNRIEEKLEKVKRLAYERGFSGWEIELIVYRLKNTEEGWAWLNE